MLQKLKKNRGITLIVLIITIVVLLMLAGITISQLSENGLFGKTKKSKDIYEYKSAKEIVDLKLMEVQVDCIENNKEYTITEIAKNIKNDTKIEIELYYNSTISSIKSGITENLTDLTGILVSVNEYSRFKFLIGKNCTIDKVSDDGINFVYITEYEQLNNIENNNNVELTEEQKNIINNKTIDNIKQDILNKIAEALGISQSEADFNSISETMTQAEMEFILEKYGTVQYDESYNITGIKINETGTIISMSQIYSGNYKTETSDVSSGSTYVFQNVNSDDESEKQQEFKVKKTGEYKIECWGAQGGSNGGLGAYTCGTIRLRKGDTIYICVGTQGATSTTTKGGFNGGGYSTTQSLPAGGGATDIRLVRGDTVYDQESLASRIMVAAGGSGGYFIQGQHGGALTSKFDETVFSGQKATQVSAGVDGSFGKGAISNGYSGAGGGYYGGGYCTYTGDTSGDGIWIGSENQYVTFPTNDVYTVKYGKYSSWAVGQFTGGVSLSNGVFGDPIPGVVKEGRLLSGTIYMSTGGSSYISGHEGCIAIKSQNDISPKTSEYSELSDSIHYTGRYFKDTYMCAGDETAENGESGNSGNGRVSITIL